MTQVNAGETTSQGARTGVYLVFGLGDTDYAVEVGRVREIIGLLPITRVPRLPDSVRGVINLRGKVIPVIDLRVRFGLEAVDHGRRTCIIVLQAGGGEFGVVVDRVIEVAHIEAAGIEETPHFGAAIDTDYLLGVANNGPRVRLLIDMDRAVTQEALAPLDAESDA